MSRIIIVSNRVPSLDQADPNAGGLAVGLKAALEHSGGLWLGWSGKIAQGPHGQARIDQSVPFTLATLDLSDAEHAAYYASFSNRTLWPLLHGRADLMRFDADAFATYRAVNERFARSLAPLVRSQDLVWVHDYHLMHLGRALRRLGVNAPLGFFLHVPFPAPDVLEALPCHEELLRALSAFDLIGFQTKRDMTNFRGCVSQYLGGSVSRDGTLLVFGKKIRVGAFPIGIDTKHFAALADSEDARKLSSRLQPSFRDRLGVVGVDRLDYTKGLVHRLRAFERLLDSTPSYRRRASLLQIAAPSRETVPEYSDLRTELETLSGRINARLGDIDWMPVRFLNRAFSQTHLAALFRLNRVGLVTPLNDGMNLVAKEYIAAQNSDDPGVLVLSRFAGAAEQLTAALLVNPHDIDEVARALRDALEMPLDERAARWAEMMTDLREHDIHDWRDRFLDALRTTRRSDIRSAPPMKAVPEVATAPAWKGPAAAAWPQNNGRVSLHGH